MSQTILITGGAGFIGSHLARALLRRGDRVRVLDSLIEQVHPNGRPTTLADGAELIESDVRDAIAVARAVRGVDKVVHLAAEVGVGQSMYAIDRYVGVNDYGTAVLFQALIDHPVRRVVVASSMSVYGEGLYRTLDGELVQDAERPAARSDVTGWDPVGPDGRPLVPVPTHEGKRPNIASVYAITKYMQERLTLTVAPRYGMQGVALRLFNVYGPGQALSNPYTACSTGSAPWCSRTAPSGATSCMWTTWCRRSCSRSITRMRRAACSTSAAAMTCP
jgi:dTDP-L-rhamnose 4-epimerase